MRTRLTPRVPAVRYALGPGSLTFRAPGEILRYELTNWVFGFKHFQKGLTRQQPARLQADPQSAESICEAVNLARRQKSVVTVQLLRKCGIDSRMVIRYRQSPFFPMPGSR